MHQGEGGATIQTVQSLGDVNGHENMTVDLSEATVTQDGQIYITAEDGQGKFSIAAIPTLIYSIAAKNRAERCIISDKFVSHC